MEVGQDATKGKDGFQSGGNFLYGGSTGGAFIRLGVSVSVGGNEENGGRYTHRVSAKNHGKSGAA